MAYKTCDWCGRTYKPMFSADRDTANEFANQLGLGLGVKAIGGVARLAGHRNFCCKECKLAYEQSKNDGASATGEGNTVQNEEAQRQAEREAEDAKIKDFEFSTDENEFFKQFIGMSEDYKVELKKGTHFADLYYNRMEKELKVVKATNETLYAKIQPIFDEITAAKIAKKKRNLKIGIIVGSIYAVLMLVFIIYSYIK